MVHNLRVAGATIKLISFTTFPALSTRDVVYIYIFARNISAYGDAPTKKSHFTYISTDWRNML